MKKKYFYLFFLFFFPIGSIVFSFQWIKNSLPSQSKKNIDFQELFKQANTLYSEQKYVEAKEAFQNKEKLILELNEGCDLVLSVFAELKDYENLEFFSKECLKKNVPSGIAFDGIAASFVAQNKTAQAIEILEGKRSDSSHERLLASLAHLYTIDKDWEKARSLYLELIETSSIWSAWLSRLLKNKKVFEQRVFLQKLAKIIFLKEFGFPKVEGRLLQIFKDFKLNYEFNTLQNRLSKK